MYGRHSEAMMSVAPEWFLQLPYPSPTLQQNEELEVFQSKCKEDNDAAVDICGFIAAAHKGMDFWNRFVKTQDVLHLHYDADPAHGSGLEASLRQHGVDCSRGLLSITAADAVVK